MAAAEKRVVPGGEGDEAGWCRAMENRPREGSDWVGQEISKVADLKLKKARDHQRRPELLHARARAGQQDR